MPIEVDFKIGTEANSDYVIVFSVRRSSSGSVWLQVPTKFGVAGEFVHQRSVGKRIPLRPKEGTSTPYKFD